MNPDNSGLTKHDLALIKQAAEELPEIEQLILFGSRAKGTHHSGSDVDLVVQGEYVTEDTIFKLADQLNEQLPMPYFFDVLNFNTLSEPALKEHINRVGQALYKAPSKHSA